MRHGVRVCGAPAQPYALDRSGGSSPARVVALAHRRPATTRGMCIAYPKQDGLERIRDLHLTAWGCGGQPPGETQADADVTMRRGPYLSRATSTRLHSNPTPSLLLAPVSRGRPSEPEKQALAEAESDGHGARQSSPDGKQWTACHPRSPGMREASEASEADRRADQRAGEEVVQRGAQMMGGGSGGQQRT
jgi:hypothetical protein